MSLTAKDIAEIARLLDQSRFGSLDLQMGEFRLRIRRDGGGELETVRSPAQAGASEQVEEGPRLREGSAEEAGPGEVDVRAPLPGNFFAAPRPGDPPFVDVGAAVNEDTTIGIIEVMKLMNPIRAGVAGTVSAILAEDGKSVENGQPLIRVKAA